METRRRVVSAKVLMEDYRRLLQEDEIEALPLIVTGSSMTPFLIDQRDKVYLKKIDTPVLPGEIVLYQRRNGSYVLHRVFSVEDCEYTMIGDAQDQLEYAIHRDQLIARVVFCVRKDKRIEPGDFWWEFFARVWIRMIPARKPILRFVGRLKGWSDHD